MNILQIGCNAGNDDVFKFLCSYKEHLTKVILVDACTVALNKAIEHYSTTELNPIFINKAVILSSDKESTIYAPEQGVGTPLSSTIKEIVDSGHGYKEPIKGKTVEACRVSELLGLFNSTLIDRFYTDTEGLDTLIVQDIDLKKYKIPYIQFEFVHSDGHFKNGANLNNCLSYLNSNGYHVSRCNEYDLVAVKIK
jgi:hypothetical protein